MQRSSRPCHAVKISHHRTKLGLEPGGQLRWFRGYIGVLQGLCVEECGVAEGSRRKEREPHGLWGGEGERGGREDTDTQSVDSQLLTELLILTLQWIVYAIQA